MRYALSIMSTLELLIEEIKTLPEEKLKCAADYVHQLKEDTELGKRNEILASTSGSLSAEELDEWEKAIEEGCEQVHERDW